MEPLAGWEQKLLKPVLVEVDDVPISVWKSEVLLAIPITALVGTLPELVPYTYCMMLVLSYNFTWKLSEAPPPGTVQLFHSTVNTRLGDVPEV